MFAPLGAFPFLFITSLDLSNPPARTYHTYDRDTQTGGHDELLHHASHIEIREEPVVILNSGVDGREPTRAFHAISKCRALHSAEALKEGRHRGHVATANADETSYG